MFNPVIYVFLNKDLHMTAGKAAAQAVHAAVVGVLASTEENQKLWLSSMHRTVIVLTLENEGRAEFVRRYLSSRGVSIQEVIDEGVNEIAPHTLTAMASPIMDKDDENTKLAFSSFQLYRDTAKVTVEFPR